jgi:2-oxoglutarate dehydrogenase E2 component (dihydrolipoamide succinyltransferase)
MPTEVKVPVLGESIVEGTLARWHKHVGDAVNAGDVLAELETDKVNVEVSATTTGVVIALHKHAGDTVAVGELIATIDEHAVAAAATAPATPKCGTGRTTPTPAP